MSRWLEFADATPQDGRKTSVWDVLSKAGRGLLGEVRWFGRWRQYAFFPCGDTAWNPECLRDVSAFIERQMELRRAS